MNNEELRRLATEANRSGHYTPLQKVVTPDVVLALLDEIDRLEDAAKADAAAYHLVCVERAQRGADLDALRTRLVEVEKDAARYRWMRDSQYPDDGMSIQWDGDGTMEAYIDSAMGAQA